MEKKEIPTNLKHKPVIVCENYSNVDGKTAYETDVQGLSLGLAQWNDRGNVDISAKIWRYTGDKWSRQSEEMPLHRVLDLAIMVAKAFEYFQEQGYKFPDLFNPQNPKIETIGLQGDAMRLKVCTSNEMIKTDIKLFEKAFKEQGELLGERFAVLANILGQMGYNVY